ncbi:1,2-phenylacetyl-CoA epoxidase subunit PaaC [Burkholderia plantarii]|uniref:Phenylacetate-CoA oxygenase, PaaC subunit n=1 Tax=Burkholderia plantarii TaxID=41899 RepID=A0A0B6S871_BURPL|nr:phenylacetate-CoA oxygenase, PaaC subunit [Burkholderia plantarii]ALK33720.1 Phenylacetate-CoA oxygenase subunit PaaI [Burkholderia plantarii]GLZ16894.1 phenylacetic acid degradation protein [Burkholderia plantarii]
MKTHNGFDMGLADYVLRLGDNCLILSQRLCAWCGHGPTLEEDLALSNVALDYLGQARLWLDYAGSLHPVARGEDELAFLREAGEFRNVLLVEQPNQDFADLQMRLFLFDSWYALVLAALAHSRDAQIAAIAAKSAKENAYHLRRSSHWIVRLAGGTELSRAKLLRALDGCWEYTGELFEMDELDRAMLERGIGCNLADLHVKWQSYVKDVFDEAGIALPTGALRTQSGKRGEHSEHLVWLLMEMQYLQRAHPGAQW